MKRATDFMNQRKRNSLHLRGKISRVMIADRDTWLGLTVDVVGSSNINVHEKINGLGGRWHTAATNTENAVIVISFFFSQTQHP